MGKLNGVNRIHWSVQGQRIHIQASVVITAEELD